ncbi:MAG: O-antigen ligase family protein [Chloroflexi bacterium]|nr:O-antigen ligase family protein [Chloroflexota bacterium]
MNFRQPLPLAFALSVALFLLSAFLGALISYNTVLAWNRFAALALGVAVCVFFVAMPEKIRAFGKSEFPVMRVTLVLLPVALISYFALASDWNARLGKVVWLDPVLHWFAAWQPRVPGLALDANSFGGALALLIPLQVAALWYERTAERAISASLLFVSLLGLIVSAARGAWIAFGLVAWIAAMGFVLARVMPGLRSGRTRVAIWVALVAYLALTVGIALTLTPLGAMLMSEGGGHWLIAGNSLDLASDYPFSGIGLGAFTMAYSSYVLLVHVPHTIHAHNLFLDIWLEQGLLGLVAFLGLIIVGGLNAPGSRWRTAALASLGVLLLHGLLDDAFYGYGAGALSLLLIPLGVLARDAVTAQTRFPRWLAPVLAGACALIAMFVAFAPATRAMIEANLGALAQTRAELAVYEWPRYSFQDQLRRNGIVNLNPAIAHYQNALALDPTNATAQRRLGQIALSLGQYDAARRHFEIAYTRAPHHIATRLLLGELDALDSKPEHAVAWWRAIDMNAEPLQTRLWWYEFIGDQARLQKMILATQRIKY